MRSSSRWEECTACFSFDFWPLCTHRPSPPYLLHLPLSLAPSSSHTHKHSHTLSLSSFIALWRHLCHQWEAGGSCQPRGVCRESGCGGGALPRPRSGGTAAASAGGKAAGGRVGRGRKAGGLGGSSLQQVRLSSHIHSLPPSLFHPPTRPFILSLPRSLTTHLLICA